MSPLTREGTKSNKNMRCIYWRCSIWKCLHTFFCLILSVYFPSRQGVQHCYFFFVSSEIEINAPHSGWCSTFTHTNNFIYLWDVPVTLKKARSIYVFSALLFARLSLAEATFKSTSGKEKDLRRDTQPHTVILCICAHWLFSFLSVLFFLFFFLLSIFSFISSILSYSWHMLHWHAEKKEQISFLASVTRPLSSLDIKRHSKKKEEEEKRKRAKLESQE